jgi:hypothetical protein
MTLMPSIPSSAPPLLAWQLVKRPGSNAYDALVGERIWMYGVYPSLAEGTGAPALFRPFEVYERFVRRLLARCHIGAGPRKYDHSFAVRQDEDVPMFVGRPPIDAPSPHKRRGVLTLKFEDDLGNQPTSLLSVYFRGRATSKIKRHLSAGASPINAGAPPINLDAGISGEFTSDWSVEPVRDDPLVTVRLLTGNSLAEYLNDYIPHLLSEADDTYSPGPYATQGDDNDSLQRFFNEVSNSVSDNLEMDKRIEEMSLLPGERIDFSIRGELSPERSSYFAVETFTEDGSVVSDVVELFADRFGRVYEY